MKVLIIGNGIAGMSAAIEAAELDDEVILVSRFSQNVHSQLWQQKESMQ